MYCIEFIGDDDLEIRFGKIISVFVRGKTHCSKKIPDDLKDRCIHLFEKMIGQLSRPDVLWTKEIQDNKVVYKGLKIKLSAIDNDILNFNNLKHKTNIFIVHLKTKLGMNYKLVHSSYENNISKILYVLF